MITRTATVALPERRFPQKAEGEALMRRAALLGLWVAAWMLLTWLCSRTPPLDNAEQLSWVRQLAWGYYKHPPLPTAFLWPWVQLFGVEEWVTYAAAAAVSGGGLLLTWRLVAQLAGVRAADVSMLATLCSVHFSQRLPHFNHDVLLMPCVVAAAACCWAAFERRSRLAWVGVGVALGLGALAKYQVALAGVAVVVWWLHERAWRDPVHRTGLGVATVLALAIVGPNLAWVVSHDFLPLHYAVNNSLAHDVSAHAGRGSVPKWLGDQLTMALGSMLLLAAVHWRAGRGPASLVGGEAAHSMRVRHFLLCWGVLPLATIPLLGLALDARLHANWAFAYLPLTAAAVAVWVEGGRWKWLRWREIWLIFAGVQAILVAVTLRSALDPWPGQSLSSHPRRFASQALADQIGPPARLALGGSLRVIAGPFRLASVLALRLSERPLVLIDGRHDVSPWVPDGLEGRCGVLWVGGAHESPPAGAQPHAFGDGLWWAVQPAHSGAAACDPL